MPSKVALAALGFPARLPVEPLAGLGAGLLLGLFGAGRSSDRVLRVASPVTAAAGSLFAVSRGLSA